MNQWKWNFIELSLTTWVEINATEKATTEKLSKNFDFETINKIDKLLGRLNKNKKEKHKFKIPGTK